MQHDRLINATNPLLSAFSWFKRRLTYEFKQLRFSVPQYTKISQTLATKNDKLTKTRTALKLSTDSTLNSKIYWTLNSFFYDTVL